MSECIDSLLEIPQEILITLVHDLAVNGFDISNCHGVITIYKFEEVVKEFVDWSTAIGFIDGYMTAKAE